MQLEETKGDFKPVIDRRKRLDEPLPVRLVTVEDATLRCAAGLELELDAFYVGLLEFERDASRPHEIIYHAENFDLRFDVGEPPLHRETLRALGIEVLSLAVAEKKLIEREIGYTRQKGLTPGHDALLLLDPAGNWIQLTELRAI
jgi:hypothetical protein